MNNQHNLGFIMTKNGIVSIKFFVEFLQSSALLWNNCCVSVDKVVCDFFNFRKVALKIYNSIGGFIVFRLKDTNYMILVIKLSHLIINGHLFNLKSWVEHLFIIYGQKESMGQTCECAVSILVY